MSRYMVFDLKDIQTTEYEYEVGETITVNSDLKYKCMGVFAKDDDIYYLFNVGVPRYEYKEVTQTDIDDFANKIK